MWKNKSIDWSKLNDEEKKNKSEFVMPLRLFVMFSVTSLSSFSREKQIACNERELLQHHGLPQDGTSMRKERCLALNNMKDWWTNFLGH